MTKRILFLVAMAAATPVSAQTVTSATPTAVRSAVLADTFDVTRVVTSWVKVPARPARVSPLARGSVQPQATNEPAAPATVSFTVEIHWRALLNNEVVDDDVSKVYSGAEAVALQAGALQAMRGGSTYLASWQSVIKAKLQADNLIGK